MTRGIATGTALAWALLLIPTWISALHNDDHQSVRSGSQKGRALDETTNVPTAYVRLEGDSVQIDGYGASAVGSTITIFAAGIFSISGVLEDGQIRVDAGKDDKVVLALNGANITSSQSAPIFVLSADKTTIFLVDATDNVISDREFHDTQDEANAAIYSKDDLDIDGSGTLLVQANYNHGIVSNDDLKIKGGNIVIHAVNDGMKGKDSILIQDGSSTEVVAGGDGLQSSKEDDADKGFVEIQGGILNITATFDGIQAASSVTILDGNITIATTGGGESRDSAKGIKAQVNIVVEDGTIQIDSTDDAIHADEDVTINGGHLLLASGDGAVRGDSSLIINDGLVKISQSYEGLAAPYVTINGGNIRILASNDGINAAGGNNVASDLPDAGGPIVGRGRPSCNVSEDSLLSINGGYVYIDSGNDGDGIDSNGHINITGGTLIVNGPTESTSGALDTEGVLKVSGGFLLAVGSAEMAQSPNSAASTQLSIRYIFDSVQAAGTMIHMENPRSGMVMFSFLPAKEFQSLVFSSRELVIGETYDIYIGGFVADSPSPSKDGLWGKGTYRPGTLVGNASLDGMVYNESKNLGYQISCSSPPDGQGTSSGESATSLESDTAASTQSNESSSSSVLSVCHLGAVILAAALLLL
ncbi:expressed unknown protein [Seminavis robusta]|uniref:Carbohydrate-binding domain-containing protein n=1 Tax=Seminavis robusta TaxID=568900 RepID=A0A9N8E9G1_9STRA|nr:expressed unknown protein [Seminavis robusta]|eukprot:Sro695_g188580.1 n/a (644) ;mRNA; f:1585-3516